MEAMGNAEYCKVFIIGILFGLFLKLSAVCNGDELLITISSPLCTDNKITLTCNVENASQIPFHYQWSVDGVTKVGGPTYTMQAVLPQLVVVTCEVFARKDDNATIQHGRNSVTILPNGNGVIPQIDFQNVQPNNVVYPSNFLPFNLTAIVVSNSNLTSLHWSPPEASNRPVPNRTITDHHGNLTTTTLMLLEYDPSGKYTLTAVNECGENSSQVDMATYFGIPSVYIDPTFTAMFVVFVVFVVFIILATITIVVPVTLVRFCYRKCTAPVEDELHELTDEILDKYIVSELLPFREKLGKALNVPNDFLKGDLPADPSEQLKAILREWQATEDHPLANKLNKKLEQLGLKDLIPSYESLDMNMHV